MHRCPIGECPQQLRDDLLMCREHWMRVPAAIRHRVLRIWRRLGTEALRDPEYLEARDQAIAAAAGTVVS